MSQIFNYEQINHNDDYEGNIMIHNFTNVLFRTQTSSLSNFQAQLGVTDDKKIISTTNKQLSFLVKKYVHFLGDNYANDLKNTYNELISSTNYETI
jgi:hypothetical protein